MAFVCPKKRHAKQQLNSYMYRIELNPAAISIFPVMLDIMGKLSYLSQERRHWLLNF